MTSACQEIADRKKKNSPATPVAVLTNGVTGLFMQVCCAARLPHLLGRQGLDHLQGNFRPHALLSLDSRPANVR